MNTETFTSADIAYDFLTANGATPAVEALASCETKTTGLLTAEYIRDCVIPSVEQANFDVCASGDDTGDVDAYRCPTVRECRADIAAALDMLAVEIADDYGDN